MSAMRSLPPDARTLSMQQDALRRVREMQTRARQNLAQSAPPAPVSTPPPQPARPMASPATQHLPAGRTPPFVGGRPGPAHPPPPAGGPRPTGLLELLRSRRVNDSLGGLGETLSGTLSSISEPLSGLLDSFGIDGEMLIILLVMWIIFNERGDTTLLLALGYLLL